MRNVQEHYFLKCVTALMGIEDTLNNHYVFLQANIIDYSDREMCRKILGDCAIGDKNGIAEITVSCYRKN